MSEKGKNWAREDTYSLNGGMKWGNKAGQAASREHLPTKEYKEVADQVRKEIE